RCAFMEDTFEIRTPHKLAATEQASLFAACDDHLRSIVEALHPEWLIGVGDFAWRRGQAVFQTWEPSLGRIQHPSPASPVANRNWAAQVTRQLEELGIWNGTERCA